ETENMELKNKVQDLENQLRITQVSTPPAGSMTPKSPSTDIFDMIPFSPISHQSSMPTRNGTQPPPVPSRSTEIKRDLFGAEPFDPFNCGAADFPPDIQSKLDEMQVTVLTDWPINDLFHFDMGQRKCYVPKLWFPSIIFTIKTGLK
ncbi:GULP1 isoform 4, partial [Pongo abelii]